MNLIWATRGKSWDFRFLLDGGYRDPLVTYEHAFSDFHGEPLVCQQVDKDVALRFPDPLGRKDDAGRVIPHDFVVMGTLTSRAESVADGLANIWPLVAAIYEQVWSAEKPPPAGFVRTAFDAAG